MPAPLLVAVPGLSLPSEYDESMGSGLNHHFVKSVLMPVILAAITFGLENRNGMRGPEIG